MPIRSVVTGHLVARAASGRGSADFGGRGCTGGASGDIRAAQAYRRAARRPRVAAIGPRDGNHSCDLTAVDLTLAGAGRVLELREMFRPMCGRVIRTPMDMATGRLGIHTEPDKGGSSERMIRAGSVLRDGRRQRPPRRGSGGPTISKRCSNPALRRRKTVPTASCTACSCHSRGPLVNVFRMEGAGQIRKVPNLARNSQRLGWHPTHLAGTRTRRSTRRACACRAPQVVEVRLPADLVEGGEFVTGGTLDATAGGEGRAQLQVVVGGPTHRRCFACLADHRRATTRRRGNDSRWHSPIIRQVSPAVAL